MHIVYYWMKKYVQYYVCVIFCRITAISSWIGLAINLEEFIIKENLIGVDVPTEFGNLMSLVSFDISFNEINEPLDTSVYTNLLNLEVGKQLLGWMIYCVLFPLLTE